MARLTAFSPFEFLRRMGVKDQGEARLELVEAMQPTIEVAPGAGLLFPPVLPPTCIAGGFRVATALHNPFVRITAGPSGCHIRAFTISNTAGTSVWAWRVVPVAGQLVAGTLVPIANQDLSERGDVRSSAAIGDVLTAGQIPFATNPSQEVLARGVPEVPELYIAAGRVFEISNGDASPANAIFAALIQDAFGPEPLA